MSKTGLVYDDRYLEHDTGRGHPERPERLQHLMAHLRGVELFDRLTLLSPRPAALEWIELIHPAEYIERVRRACQPGLHFLDADTVVGERSFEVARLAVGGAIAACDAVLGGELDHAFCAVRPPGHHAEPNRAMGFCLFNNVAVAARYVQNQYSIERVCILDWDVHHGNGTQNAFYDDGTVFYISLHQHPLYPGTGRAEERGVGEGAGRTLNFPIPAGKDDGYYLELLEERVEPEVVDFDPDFLLISAGFDAHRDDPLASMALTERGFAEMTRLVKEWAAECCAGRLVSLLEGGYNLDALARSVHEHLRCLVA